MCCAANDNFVYVGCSAGRLCKINSLTGNIASVVIQKRVIKAQVISDIISVQLGLFEGKEYLVAATITSLHLLDTLSLKEVDVTLISSKISSMDQ